MPSVRCRFPRAAYYRLRRSLSCQLPSVRIAILEGAFGDLTNPWDGEIDMMIGACAPVAGCRYRAATPVQRPPGQPWTQGPPAFGQRADIAKLAEYPWVCRRWTPLQMQCQSMFDAAGSTAAVPHRMRSFITIRQLLITTDFLTLCRPIRSRSNWRPVGWDHCRCTARPVTNNRDQHADRMAANGTAIGTFRPVEASGARRIIR